MLSEGLVPHGGEALVEEGLGEGHGGHPQVRDLVAVVQGVSLGLAAHVVDQVAQLVRLGAE